MNRLKNPLRPVLQRTISRARPVDRHVATRVLLLGFGITPEPKPDELLDTIRIRSEGRFANNAGFRTPKKKYSSRHTVDAFFEPGIPTIYDYHIVVVSKEAVRYCKSLLSDKKDDFVSLMRAAFPGTLVVPIIGGNRNYESWVPSIDNLKERNGDSLN